MGTRVTTTVCRRSLTVTVLTLIVAGCACGAEPGLLDLGQGINAYNSRDFIGAVSHLRTARSVTLLSDYVTYHLAYSLVLTGDVDGALSVLTAYRANPIDSSPLAGKISLLYGRTLLDKRDPELSAKALKVLQSDYKTLPQPDGDFALGLAYEALGEQPQAALSYERVFYGSPNTDLAAQSWTAMERLRMVLGKDFPTPTASQQLDRCEKWLAAKEYVKARQEYSVLAESLTGIERDDARVGIGASDYLAGNTTVALRYLKALHVTRPEADAERLYYVTEAARKSGPSVDTDAEMMEAVKKLGEHYPESPWRLKALVAAGNRYLLTNDREQYIPLFKAAAETFPTDGTAAYSHWKVAWDAYLTGNPERAMLLREQVEEYADDSHAGTALYFLGRIAESNGKYGEARAYYDRLSAQFPHYYYAVLARERVRAQAVADATPDDAAIMWLADVDWPVHRDLSATEPNTATEQRIERARLLTGAGLPDVAEAELRFGAVTENEQPQLLALELAQSAESAFRALRIMKSFSGDYLSLPLDKAPVKFWQMLFPLPYKDEVFVNARERGLDPWDVAALIRQESEFNPGAKSRANAYGLMQLRPATGRMLGKQQGMIVPTNLLLNPGVSIKLGTEYLRQQLASWDGDLFRTLAAYNAGPGRVHQWLMWSNYREPAEFVESIPFTETREYIQAVLRNADIYRELYGKGNVPVPEGKTPPPVKLATAVRPRNAGPVPAKRVAVSSKQPVPAPRKAAAKKAVAADRSDTQKKREPA
jgi:soluble lytic murein transglycosylase